MNWFRLHHIVIKILDLQLRLNLSIPTHKNPQKFLVSNYKRFCCFLETQAKNST